MDYKFLDKVVDMIVRETRMDHEDERLYTPFTSPIPCLSFSPVQALSYFRGSFTTHCNVVYGLNIQEIEYVWNEYREIVIDKINNG
tara:strand:+ start:416 stop:673 length:258 start_codon:yes stop_codon:yes gene_type:complete